MPLVKKYPVDNAFHCLVYRGIIKNNIGSFSAEFQCGSFIGACNSSLNNFAYISRSRECNFIYIRMIHEGCTSSTCTSNDIYNTGWQVCFLYNFSKLQSR